MVQAIPVVGDIADGVAAADQAAKGNYLPALAAVGIGLLTPDSMEVGIKGADLDDYATRALRERQAKEAASKTRPVVPKAKGRRAGAIYDAEVINADSPHVIGRGGGDRIYDGDYF